MPFDTCSAQAPCPEQTSPLSRPTGQAMAVVMSNAALSRRRLPMALGLPDGVCRSGRVLLVTLWLLPAIDASVPGRRAAPQRTPLQEPPHETRTWVLAPQLSPGVAETSPRSGTRLEGRRPELFKSAGRARTCNQTLPKRASPARRRRGERLDIASTTTSRSLRRGGPPRAAKAHNIQAALQTA